MPFQRFMAERFSGGSSLVTPPDLLPPTFWRRLVNSRLSRLVGTVSSRAGMTAQSGALGGFVYALWTRFGVSSDNRYVHHGSTVSRLSNAWASATVLSSSAGVTPVSAANMVDGGGGVQTYFTSTDVGQKKDDGTTLTTWGIAPPTAAISAVALATDLSTTIDGMNTAANWTVTAGLSAGPTDETNIKQEGTGSITITIAASTLGTIARSLGGTLNLDTLTNGDATVKADDYIHLWVRADRPDYVSYLQLDFDLDTTTVANAFRTNYYSIRLSGLTWLNQGRDQWSKIQVPKSQFQRFGTSTSLDWADVECVRISALITTEGTCKLYFDDLKLRGGTDIVGSVRYALCYRNDTTKARGNPYLDSDEQVVYTTALDVDRQRVSLTTSNVIQGGANHPGDTQITHMRLYRSIDEGDALQIDEIVDTTASPYVDDVSVASTLLSRVLESDNNVPPTARRVFGPGNQNRLFALVGQNDLYCSKAWEPNENRAENWPSTFRTKIGDGSEYAYAGLVTDTTVLVWSDEQTYSVQGIGADTYLAVPIPNSRGVVGSLAVTEGDGMVFFVAPDGIYAQQSLRQERITESIAPFFQGLTVDGQAGWNTTPAALAQTVLVWQSHPVAPFVLMLYAAGGESTPTHELYIGRNPATGRYEHISFDVRGGSYLQSLYADPVNQQLFGGGADGLVYLVEDETATDDNGSGFAWEILSPSQTHGRPDRGVYASQLFVEAQTNGQALTVEMAYNHYQITSAVSTTYSSTDATTSTSFALDAPETRREDVGVRFKATALTNRVDLHRYGWDYELQPETITIWDSGVIDFGWQAVVAGLWYTIQAPAPVTVAIRMDQETPVTYTIPATGAIRQAGRFYCAAGLRGRAVRVTMTSTTMWRRYETYLKVKPWGTALGARDVRLGVAS